MAQLFPNWHFSDSVSKTYCESDSDSDSIKSSSSSSTYTSSSAQPSSPFRTRDVSPAKMSQSVLPKDTADVQTYDTNLTMSCITEAEEAARKKSPVLTDSENPVGSYEEKMDSPKSVLNAIENAELQTQSSISILNNVERAANTLGSNLSHELSTPEVIKLLVTMNDSISSLKREVQQNSTKLEQIQTKQQQLIDIVTQDIAVSQNFRPQMSNEVSELKSVLQEEQLRCDTN